MQRQVLEECLDGDNRFRQVPLRLDEHRRVRFGRGHGNPACGERARGLAGACADLQRGTNRPTGVSNDRVDEFVGVAGAESLVGRRRGAEAQRAPSHRLIGARHVTHYRAHLMALEKSFGAAQQSDGPSAFKTVTASTREEGSAVEFPAFLDERQQSLLRLAIVLCGSRAPAEDVLQDVLIRAYQQWHRIGAMESPYGYVRTMLVNEHLSWRRRSARQMPTPEVDAGSRPDPAQRIADHDDLLRRVDALPDRQRAAVILRYFADLDDAEIATTLRCAPGTVRSYISRGLAALRIQLSHETDRSRFRPIAKDA